MRGLCINLVGLFGGMPFLASQLRVAGVPARGDLRVLLLGAQRAAAGGSP